jgi:hypothetical protein
MIIDPQYRQQIDFRVGAPPAAYPEWCAAMPVMPAMCHILRADFLKDPAEMRICNKMITVELGLGEQRADMELWFRRGMELNPNYYELCHNKLYYLEPKWHGEPEDMLDFGRECVRSQRWGGRVPLILVEAHDNLARYLPQANQSEYWKNPEVWADLRMAYEKFFKLKISPEKAEELKEKIPLSNYQGMLADMQDEASSLMI